MPIFDCLMEEDCDFILDILGEVENDKPNKMENENENENVT